MNRFLYLLIGLLTLASVAYAAPDTWYVFDKNGTYVGKSKKQPRATSLEDRGEKAFLGESNLDTRYLVVRGNQMKVREKTQEEKDLDEVREGTKKENDDIRKRFRKLAMDSLKAEGYVFRYVTE